MSKTNQSPEPGSYQFYIERGKESAKQIRSVRSGGYKTARKYTSFYSKPRSQDNQARKMVFAVKKLGNPKPFYIKDNTLFFLDLHSSVEKKSPQYIRARGVSSLNRLVQGNLPA